MLTKQMSYFRAKPMNVGKITILLDHGYHPQKLQTALENVYSKIRFKPLAKLSKQEKGAEGKSGFMVARWVVERSKANARKACSPFLKTLNGFPYHLITYQAGLIIGNTIGRISTHHSYYSR